LILGTAANAVGSRGELPLDDQEARQDQQGSRGGDGAMTVAIMHAVPARADHWNASTIYKDCTSAANTVPDLVCTSYLIGVIDGIAAAQINVLKGLLMYCPPRDLTTAQSHLIIIKYLEDHPEKMHLEGGEVAAAAFYDAFACCD
jgi:hypothetical protein